VNSRPRQKSEDTGQWNVSLRNAGTTPVAAQSKQHEHAAEDGQQNNADKYFEGVFTKKASSPIQ